MIRILELGNLCILGISESWLNSSVPDQMISIPQYHLFRGDRTHASGKRTGGGVCFYTHNKYNIVNRDEMTVCNPDIEIIWVQLLLKDTRPTFIGCMYRPPSSSLEAALDILDGQILELRSRHNVCDILVMGDYNVDTLKPRLPDCKKLAEFRNRLALKQLIKQPTYFQQNYHSSLDDILVSNPEYYNISGTVNTGDTDHSLIFTTRKKEKILSEPCYFYGRSFTRFNREIVSLQIGILYYQMMTQF